MSKPRILFINRSYWPDSEATGQLLTSLCEGLVDEFDVEVISGRPNHVQNRQRASTVGFVRRNGVTIHRVFHSQFSGASRVGRTLNLVTFTAAAFFASLWRSPRPDVVVTETNPSFLPILGRFIKWRYGVPFIAYLQAVHPDITIAQGRIREGWMTRWFRNLLVASCNQAGRVVVLSAGMRSRCIENGINESLIDIIPNWADCKHIESIKSEKLFRKANHLEDKFVVMHSGNLGLDQCLDPILDAATKLQRNSDIVFIFVDSGEQKARLRMVVKERGLHNTRVLPTPPPDLLDECLSAADVHIVTVPLETQRCAMPSGLYRILAAGGAVLSLSSTESDISRLVDTEEIGVICAPEPIQTLVDRLTETISRMASDPDPIRQQGLRSQQLCLEEFDQPLQVGRFAKLLQEILSPEDILAANEASERHGAARTESVEVWKEKLDSISRPA